MSLRRNVVKLIPWEASYFQKNPRVRKIRVRNSGAGMAAPILWTPGKMRSFCRKTHVHKIPRFWGGFWGGGGECRFYFYGREDFSDTFCCKKTIATKMITQFIGLAPQRFCDGNSLNSRENLHLSWEGESVSVMGESLSIFPQICLCNGYECIWQEDSVSLIGISCPQHRLCVNSQYLNCERKTSLLSQLWPDFSQRAA